MQKWEYLTATTDGHVFSINGKSQPPKQSVESVLANIGEEGWELAGIAGGDTCYSHILYFKRPKQ